MKQRPQRPMRSIESEQQQIAKQRLGLGGIRQHGAIRSLNESEAAFAHLFFESRGNFAQPGWVDLIKTPAGITQFIERAEKTIGIASDRFCNEHCFLVAVAIRE